MLAQDLFSSMLNARFRELTQQANPPYIDASAGEGADRSIEGSVSAWRRDQG
jgi:hypothetical protein